MFEVREWLKDSLITNFLPIDYFFNPASRVFWLYLASSLLIAIAFTWYSAYKHKQKFKLEISKDYWLSKSALLDYRYFFVIWFFKVYLISPLLLSAEVVAIKTIKFMNYLHSPLFLNLSAGKVALLYTFSLFLFSDFTRYWLHRWMHASDFLWQFHKVHHSAENLNPLTFYRTHPVENLLFGIRYALSAGFVTGVFFWAFGAKLSLVSIFGSNIFIGIFSLLGSNLRHSQIALGYPAWLERFFISPAQHQIHHDIKASRKNYGGYVGIWDWLFGTLMCTKDKKQPYKFGIMEGEQVVNYSTVAQLLFQPFVNIYEYLRGKIKINKDLNSAPIKQNINKSNKTNKTLEIK